ncbi:hypothetical protein ACU61A_41730 [Pseudonocardia sichuanensis]
MRRAGGHVVVPHAARAFRVVVLGFVLTVVLAACGSSSEEPTAVPTFPVPAADGGPSADSADPGDVVPDDCGEILAAGDLEALLGLPLGSVKLRTTIGVAQPSVGRTERVTCSYNRNGGPSRSLLIINATAYRDADAAAAQWRVNTDAESGQRSEVPLGSAFASLFEKGDEAVLMVAHATSNVSLVLPEQPLPGDRSPRDVLVDLALRILPAVTVNVPTGLPEPVPQAGAAR